jgi:hypothetical protein
MKEVNVELKTIDGDNRSLEQILGAKLKSHGLLRKDHLFTGIKKSALDDLKETGNYRPYNSIFAYTKEELLNSDHSQSIWNHVDDFNPVIVVWNKDAFSYNSVQEYNFKDPEKKLEAIAGIVYVTEIYN